MAISPLKVASAGAAVAFLVGAAPAVARADNAPIIVRPFAADSGDKCRLKPSRGPMGAAKGVLGWHTGSTGSQPIVDVKGTVFDQPLRDDVDRVCSDGRFTAARFTAFSANGTEDSEIRRVDDGQADFSFSLTAATPINLVVVQVCRHPLGIGIDICGPPQRFPAPIS